MGCLGCPKEGETNEPKVIVGWKAWYSDGKKYGGKTLSDWKQLPDDGLLIVMLYYNRFSTDGTLRYKRIMMGNDFYWCHPGNMDNIYAQGDEGETEIKKRYPQASIKRGAWTDDAHFQMIIDQAMADENVSELGIKPEQGTRDK